MDKIYRSTFFDPSNKNHLEAFHHLRTVGIWPKDFFPSHVVCENYWNSMIKEKIISYFMQENGFSATWKDLALGTMRVL